MRRITLGWVFVSLALVLAFAVPFSFAIETPVEEAVLKGNWKKILIILEKDDSKASDPVARLLMAHASLVTNRNNASMLLFLSVKEKEDLKLWADWTGTLLSKNPQNPNALYLSADARARIGQLEEAKEGFTQALQIKENFALAYNARGVIRVLTNDWNTAHVDFYLATKFDPNFADAYANLGTYWILKEAPEGALEAFNQAVAINPEFALAYNGRGCAYFGRGKYEYEAAIDDMEKAFELCPVLLPALSNQGLILAAMASQSMPEKTNTKPGTTLIAKSDLERMDYTSFTSADQMIQFHQSVEKSGEKDPLSAVRVYSVQLAKMGNYINDLSNKIEQRSGAIVTAGKAERDLQRLDQTLALMDIGKNVMNVIPRPKEGWNQFSGFSRKTLEIASNVVPKDTKAEYYSGVGYRAFSQNPLISILRSETYIMEKTAHTYGYLAETEISKYSSELALRTRQYYDLKQEQGKFLAQAIKQGVDFSKVDILGIEQMRIPTTSHSRIPEYSIPHQSPLTQFNVLPGAIGKDIAPVGKTPLVVVDGKTDISRLGVMLRGFEGRGVQTLPVPPNMDAQSFARIVGADRVVKITNEPGSASWLPKVPVPNPKVGGVTQDGPEIAKLQRTAR
jgi:tetratricopeptide (TPR) repeat protein